MASFPFPDKISQASSSSKDQKVIISAYGDGYEQRAALGINSMTMTWQLYLPMMTLTDRNTFRAFFDAHGRVIAFDWTPPNESAGKYVFNGPLQETNTGIRYSFSFELRQVFE